MSKKIDKFAELMKLKTSSERNTYIKNKVLKSNDHMRISRCILNVYKKSGLTNGLVTIEDASIDGFSCSLSVKMVERVYSISVVPKIIGFNKGLPEFEFDHVIGSGNASVFNEYIKGTTFFGAKPHYGKNVIYFDPTMKKGSIMYKADWLKKYVIRKFFKLEENLYVIHGATKDDLGVFKTAKEMEGFGVIANGFEIKIVYTLN